MDGYWRSVLVMLLVFLAGCAALQQIGENSPPAQTPQNLTVLAVVEKGGGWTNVGPNSIGEFEILPGGLPSGGYQLLFNAPWPGALRVRLGTVDLPRFEDIAAGTDPASTGYYRIFNIDPTPTPPAWRIGVRAPSSMLNSTRQTVSVFHVSVNPNFPVGHINHESAPLDITLAPQKLFTLTVFKDGPGRGTVTSTPEGINCGVDCIFDFGQSGTVQLQQTAASGSSFGGWTGPCLSTSTSLCPVTLNGTAVTVAATFNGGTSGSSSQSCPGAAALEGLMYLGKPACASNNSAGHPDAYLDCDGQGYFCCEGSQGANDPKCGANKRQFPPDCMGYGPKAQLRQPHGCYTASGP